MNSRFAWWQTIHLAGLAFATSGSAVAGLPPGAQTDSAIRLEVASETELTLDECLRAALQHNRQRPASRFAVAMAEAQHRQALAGYWPHVALRAAYQRTDEAPNFLFPATQMGVPPQTIQLPAGTALITVPAGVLAPVAVQLPVTTPAQTITTPGQLFPVPAQDIKLMDPDSLYASINATWLIYDGGMRRGYREQAAGQVDLSKADARRTDLVLIDTVKRYYHGAVLARQLHQLGGDTLERMEATLSLTETMYKEGSGRVKKTDFLDNKVMVESLRAMVTLLEKNEAMARAALAGALGRPWQASVRPADTALAAAPGGENLEELVGTAYRFNPDWRGLEAGLRALAGSLATARSGHAPKLALTGELHRWHNDYDAGIATTRNKTGYQVSLGVEIPLFDGFLTRHKVAAAQARISALKEQQLLLKEGLGLQIKDALLGLVAAQKSERATLEAMNAARENRDLTTRAYQSELVETEKMIRAQLTEALMTAQHYKVRHDILALRARIDLIVGADLHEKLDGR
jgi:outer membrane protein TolC